MAATVLEYEVLYTESDSGRFNFLLLLPDPEKMAGHRTAMLIQETAAASYFYRETQHCPHK